ncbi:hypothetical protein TNCV_301461 [Trichonephila clavipes]|nr:hypothetical protein TNCV_301461 [Trichonephila clavipes]
MLPGAGPVWGCGSPVVKVSDPGRHVMSSRPVPLKIRRHHWWCKRIWFPVKGKRSDGRLANIPLCGKRRRMVRPDTE